MNELKPCPFCGGEAHTTETARYGNRWGARCGSYAHCGAFLGFYINEAEAIEAWNTRAETATLYEDGFYLHGRKFVPERTCHDIKPHLPYFKCDVCGMEDMGGREIWISDGFYRGVKPNYCPNCGAKIIRGNE